MSPRRGRLGYWIVVVVSLLLLSTLVSVVPVKEGDAVGALAQGPTPDKGGAPIQVGQIQEVDLSVSHGSEVRIYHPGATYIKVHLQDLDLEPGEYLTVSDAGGARAWSYPGDDRTIDDRGGFWALSVLGDVAVVQLHSQTDKSSAESADHTASAVAVDRYAYGYLPAEAGAGLLQPQSVCGDDDRRDVACYASSFPSEYDRSGAVALLLIDGKFLCTAWRAGPLNRVLTNAHCVSSQEEVAASEVWFNYQSTACEGTELATPTIVAANTLLDADRELDYALFTVSRFSSIVPFGHLELDVRAPLAGEEIYIPQHGGGYPKQLTIDSDRDAGRLCQIREPSLFGFDASRETDAGYYCDTLGGSSGAPVLARSSHRVIAMHHLGFAGSCNNNNLNQAVRIDQIWPQVSAFFEPGDRTAAVRINELDLGISDAIELHNADSEAVDMAEWTLVTYAANSAVEVEYTFPPFTLPAASYVVVHEGSGSNTMTDLYLNHEIGWLTGGDGAALLLGSQGQGIDFVRFGSSAVPPAAGAAWEGPNAPSPPAGQTLGRDAEGRDTDDGRDWEVGLPTLGRPNVGGGRPKIQVTPLNLQQIMAPGQVVTTTLTIHNSGPMTLFFEIDTPLPDGAWLRAVPATGEVAPLAEVDVAVVVDAVGLPVGRYATELVIDSNDVDGEPVIVPVAVHVGSLLYMPLVFSSGP